MKRCEPSRDMGLNESTFLFARQVEETWSLSLNIYVPPIQTSIGSLGKRSLALSVNVIVVLMRNDQMRFVRAPR